MKTLNYYFSFMMLLLISIDITLVYADQQGLHLNFWPVVIINILITSIILTGYLYIILDSELLNTNPKQTDL
jgi:hypothetical protein